MKQYNYNETKLSFAYPDNWTIEQDKNLISIYDPLHGVGVLQFSIYYVPNSQDISLKDELEDYVSDRHQNEFAVTIKDQYAYTDYLLDEELRYWKYWLFIKDNMLVFGSYNCKRNDYGKEEKIIDEIVNAF
jgi:hypothetical protein